MSDFRDFYLDDDKCPECGTAAIYEIEEKSFGCKCTYEFEKEIEHSIDEIVAMVKQVRKEMAEERQKANENETGLTETNQRERTENDTKVINFDNNSTESA